MMRDNLSDFFEDDENKKLEKNPVFFGKNQVFVNNFIQNDGQIPTICHFATDGEHFFKVLQKETGIQYDIAIDAIPCKYTYFPTDILTNLDEEEK